MAPPLHILHIAGWSSCGFYRRASSVLASLSLLFPTRIKIVEHVFPSRSDFRAWLISDNNDDTTTGFRQKLSDVRAHEHTSSPFVWTSNTDVPSIQPTDADPADVKEFIGGAEATMDWARSFFFPQDGGNGGDDVEMNGQQEQPPLMVDDGHHPNHDYEYDLVVIGGGSGGLAASKEASAQGAKVAVLDFVKPSPAGTTWGLGGTCVNVGCIPKKLMHIAALQKESIEMDSGAFGIKTSPRTDDNEEENDSASAHFMNPPPVEMQHSWETMRENVQNFIRGLNFKYRVQLREKEVKYLNKLGKFINNHTLEVTDKKGKTSTLTSSRFLIAVGGRPAPLDCEGGELAISSDDIFALEKPPGRTLCIGASYISLECAGFLRSLGFDVTVAVRSILLRGFDRECADKIGVYMESRGVNFRKGVVPKKLEKVGDQIRVTFSDDSTDDYDTVLTAIGRTADTSKLGLDTVGVQCNPKNGKIPAVLEQTSCPNIYAIGDVMEGCPELTPVAIQAGIFLSRRLFGNSKEPMNYRNVCTTVFTPIEYATVGYSEEDAKEEFGESNIEVYHKSFMPLDWGISPGRSHYEAFAKVIVHTSNNNKVLGIHYVGPTAGEIMQGYGVAMKKGMTFEELQDTVGIHPTSSEELVTMSISKSSGEDPSQGAC